MKNLNRREFLKLSGLTLFSFLFPDVNLSDRLSETQKVNSKHQYPYLERPDGTIERLKSYSIEFLSEVRTADGNWSYRFSDSIQVCLEYENGEYEGIYIVDGINKKNTEVFLAHTETSDFVTIEFSGYKIYDSVERLYQF